MFVIKVFFLRLKNIIENIWNDGEESLIAGIITAYTECCNSTDIPYSSVKIYNQDMSMLKEKIQEKGIQEIPDSSKPILRFKKNEWICLAGRNLFCQNIKKLAGLGDNISSAGFVYHNKKLY